MATYTTSTLSVGVHYIVAVYNGDATTLGSTSNTVIQHVDPPPSATVSTPSSPQSGSVTISYTLTDAESNTCSVQAQYSPDGGTTWNTAAAGSGGDGTTGLISSPSGTPHTFVWASGSDIVNADNANVKFRITPSDPVVGTAGTTGAFTVDNSENPPSPTVTTLSSDHPDDSVYGQAVTFTAIVTATGAGTPTGTVQFVIDAQNYSSPVPLNYGTASISVSTLHFGIHQIEAIYTSDDPSAFADSQTAEPLQQLVMQAPLTITPADVTKTYGETVTLADTDFSTKGLVNGDTVTSVTLKSDGAPATATVALSPYDINASSPQGTGLENYTITYDPGQLSVTKAPLTVTADDRTKTYGDAVTFAGTEFTPKGLVNSDTVASVTLTSAGAAATATVKGSPYDILASDAVGTGLGNYTITYHAGKLSVEQKSLTVTADDQTETYGNAMTFAGTEFTTSGLVNGDTVASVTLSSNGAAATATVAGSPYDIVASDALGTGLGNYTINYQHGQLSVTKAPLTVIANDQTKVYGAANPPLTATISGFVNGETSSVVSGSAALSTTATVVSAVGLCPITVAQGTLAAANYAFTTFNPGQLSVLARALDVTAADRTKTYGDAVTFAGSEFTPSGLVNGDTVASVTLTSEGAAATATVNGSPYDIVASNAVGTGLGNYTITYHAGNLSVSTKTLTVTAADQTETYGNAMTFAGTEFTAVGLVNGDTVSSVTLSSDGAAATATVAGSPYPIVAGDALGTGLGNYTIAYESGKLSVTKAPLTVIANDRGKTYGDLVTFAGTEFSTNGLVNGDTLSSVTLTSDGAAVTAPVKITPYDIAPTGAVGTGLDNYTITYQTGQLTVNPKALTITADNKMKSQGAPLPTWTFTCAGLVGNDSLTAQPTLSTNATAASPLGKDPITISGGTAGSNYTVTLVNGNLTVIADDTVGGYDSTTSRFFLRDSNTAGFGDTDLLFGVPSSDLIPLCGDWDGTGTETVGLYNRTTSVFYLRNSNNSGMADTVFWYGLAGSRFTPLVGDWDGNGTDTVGLYDPQNQVFYLRNSNTTGTADISPFQLVGGNSGEVPIVGDWDGNGKDTVGLYDPTNSEFYLRNSNTAGSPDITPFRYDGGSSGEKSLIGDWSGAGQDSMGLYNSANSFFYLRNSNTTGGADITPFMFGPAQTATWTPLVGHWIGSGQALMAAEQVAAAPHTPALTPAELQPMVQEAITRWANAGLDASAIAKLKQVQFVISDLPGSYLGETEGNQVNMDVNAAGNGWFVDPTPASDEEFAPSGSQQQLAAVDPRAVDKIDLLTVVEHELGHVAGLNDQDALTNDIMSGVLGTGVRRNASHVDAILAS